MSKKNAIRKLREFHRWQRIANSLDLSYNERYQFDIEYHPTRRKYLEISRECALEELDAIRYAINQLSKIEYRKILIEC
ncbi:TPA: ArpU family transcriptional regulator, partial [Streptococcus pyogenes]